MHGHIESVHYLYIFVSILALGFILRVALTFRDKEQVRAGIFLRADKMAAAFSLVFWGTGIPLVLGLILAFVGTIAELEALIMLGSILHVAALSALTYSIVRLWLVRGV